MARLSGNLSEVQTGLTTAVSSCVDAACTAISGSTGSLATGFDVSDVRNFSEIKIMYGILYCILYGNFLQTSKLSFKLLQM